MLHRLIGFLMFLPIVIWVLIRVIAMVQFNMHCGGYMELAATANTVEMARTEMEKVVRYAEQNGLTEGYTSVVWKSPSQDVGFWYKNLKSALQELRDTDPNATTLEKSNMLMKLRESLTRDSGDSGTENVVPAGISIFPYNKAFTIVGVFGLVFACIGGIMLNKNGL